MSGLAKWLGGVAVNPTLATYETEKMAATVGPKDDTNTWPILAASFFFKTENRHPKKANKNSNQNQCHQRGSVPSP